MAIIVNDKEYRFLQAQLTATMVAAPYTSIEPAIAAAESIMNRLGIEMARPMHGGPAVEMPRCPICHKTIYPGEKSVPNEFGGRAHESCKRAPTAL